MNRVLVTGGSSPLGDVLVPRLAQEYEVVAIARSDAAADRLRVHGVEILRYDLQSTDPVPPLETMPIVHAAGIGLARSLDSLLSMVNPRHLIAISSASATVAGHPRREDVLEGEQLLQAAAPDVTALRPTMIYGSWCDRNVRRLWQRTRRLPVLPRVRGGGYLQPVLADDLAAAVAESLRQPRSGVFPVGGPVPVRVDDVLGALAAATGRRRGGPAVPLGRLAQLVRHAPMPAGGARSKHAVQMLLVDRTVPPPTAAGFSYAATSLDEGMRLAVERYRSGGTC